MFREICYSITIVLLSLAAGCSTLMAPEKIDITPEALSDIRSIVVIMPPEIKNYSFFNWGRLRSPSPDVPQGTIGNISSESSVAIEKQLTKALKNQNLSVASILAENVAAGLSEQGFETSVEEVQWKVNDSPDVAISDVYEFDYERIYSDADAVMIIKPYIAGFIAKSSNADYLPTLYTVVNLLDKTRKNKLYISRHVSGWPTSMNFKYVPPSMVFTSLGEIMANPGGAATSLHDASVAIAESIVRDFVF